MKKLLITLTLTMGITANVYADNSNNSDDNRGFFHRLFGTTETVTEGAVETPGVVLAGQKYHTHDDGLIHSDESRCHYHREYDIKNKDNEIVGMVKHCQVNFTGEHHKYVTYYIIDRWNNDVVGTVVNGEINWGITESQTMDMNNDGMDIDQN